jgi:hypothetical protein
VRLCSQALTAIEALSLGILHRLKQILTPGATWTQTSHRSPVNVVYRSKRLLVTSHVSTDFNNQNRS